MKCGCPHIFSMCGLLDAQSRVRLLCSCCLIILPHSQLVTHQITHQFVFLHFLAAPHMPIGLCNEGVFTVTSVVSSTPGAQAVRDSRGLLPRLGFMAL